MLEDSLRDLPDRVEGCRAVFLVGLDGMIIAGTGEGGREAWELAASYADLLRRTARVHAEAALGAPVEVVVGSDTATFVLRILGPDYAILMILVPAASLGRARFELRKGAERLHSEL